MNSNTSSNHEKFAHYSLNSSAAENQDFPKSDNFQKL